MEEKGRMWRVVEVRGKEEEGLGGNDRRKMEPLERVGEKEGVERGIERDKWKCVGGRRVEMEGGQRVEIEGGQSEDGEREGLRMG